MGKIRGSKKLKLKNKKIFYFGYIIIFIFLITVTFCIGRTIGKKEAFNSKRKYTEDMNEKIINHQLMILNQI